MSTTVPEENERQFNKNKIAKYIMGVTVRLTGVQAHRIRRYEETGLLKPARTGAGQRLYSDAEIELIKEIARFEKQGVNLQGIKIILAMKKARGYNRHER